MGMCGRLLCRALRHSRWRTNTACSTWPMPNSCEALFDEIQAGHHRAGSRSDRHQRTGCTRPNVAPKWCLAPKSHPFAWTANACACSRTKNWACRPPRTASPARWKSFALGLRNGRLPVRGQADYELFRSRPVRGSFRRRHRRRLDRSTGRPSRRTTRATFPA